MDEQQPVHIPVLLREVIEYLGIKPGMKILDATVGLGGHSRGMLDAAGGEGQVLGLDRDREALSEAGRRLAPYGERVRLVRSRLSRFPAILAETGWEKVDAALLDAGMSSLQLDDPERGFGFLNDGPLDMRMGAEDGGESAEGLINLAPFARLAEIIREYGEDPQAGRIARAIVAAREQAPAKHRRPGRCQCPDRAGRCRRGLARPDTTPGNTTPRPSRYWPDIR